MKLDELEKWLETEEGKKWLEGKKEPLLKKNTQLLDEIAGYKKRLTDATEQGNALNGKLNGYLEKLKRELCLNCLDDFNTFKSRILPDPELREFVINRIEKMADADGGLKPDINDNGDFVYQTADGKNFKDYYGEWLETESAKSYIENQSCGGGAKGSDPLTPDSSFTRNAIKKMSPEEVAANLDKPAFRSALNS